MAATRTRKFGWGLVLGALALFCLAVVLVFGDYTFVMSEANLQERVDAKLPLRNAAGNTEVTEAKVSLGESDLTVLLVMNGERLRQAFDLVAQSTGTPYYRAGAFFFKAEKVEIKEFAFREGSLPAKLRRIGERYLGGPRARRLVKAVAPKAEAWAKERAERAAVYALHRIPVYRITEKTKWGPIIRAALVQVEVKANQLHLRLNVWQLTLDALLVAAIAVVCLVAAVAILRTAGIGAALDG